MRAPSWESSAGALAAFLNATTQAYMVDLFTFTLSGGAVIRYTSADTLVAVAGNTYGLGPTITRGTTKLTVGLSVDTLDLTLCADASVTINGVPLLAFVATGGFDGARLSLDRAFASAPGAAWVGVLNLFQGRISDANASRYQAQITVNSDLELLNVMVPRNVYQPGCSNTLFDGACGLSKAAYANGTTCTSASDPTMTVFGSSSGAANGHWALGFAVGSTGANAGVSRTIKDFTGGVITTIQPWPQPVAVGDTFVLYPGCDKTQNTCSAKFGNLARFRGQPYVPAPETVT